MSRLSVAACVASLWVSCPRCRRNSFNQCVSPNGVERGPHYTRALLAAKTPCRASQASWCACGGHHFAACRGTIGRLGEHVWLPMVCDGRQRA